MSRPSVLRVVVDRREGKIAVLIDDHGESFDVPAAQLPNGCRSEGAVLDVPMDGTGQPLWREARRNAAEENNRLRENRERLDRLKRRDPGGDVQL